VKISAEEMERLIEAERQSWPAPARVISGTVLPRFIRHKDAPAYLGVDRNKFNAEIRPRLVEIPLGTRSLAFDRLDLDAWADDYKNRNGRSSRISGKLTCEQEQKAFKSPTQARGLSTKSTKSSVFSSASASSVKTTPRPGSERSKKKSMSNLERVRKELSGKLR
jgi:hypothetical protein